MKVPTALSGLVLLAALAAPAHAALALDTGTPVDQAMPLTLDGNDYYAAEFNLSQTSVINSVAAFLTAGLDQGGATFTIAIYAGDALLSRFGTPDFAAQGTYTADGWNMTNGLDFVEGPGNYWVALEVGALDSATGLGLPMPPIGGGTVPALAFAFNAGGGYVTDGALPFAVQVEVSPVPEPSAALLMGAGLALVAAAFWRRGGTR
jgi:hypothetical protein